jgi:oligosaccharide repeat unit polymerase
VLNRYPPITLFAAISIIPIVAATTTLTHAYLSGIGFIAVILIFSTRVWISRRSILDSPLYIAVLSYSLFLGIGSLFSHREAYSGDLPLVLSWLGLGLVGFGYWLGGHIFRSHPRRSYPNVAGDQHVSLERLRLIGIFFTTCGALAVALYVWRIGGWNTLLSTPYGLRPPYLSYEAEMMRWQYPGLFFLYAWAILKERIPPVWTLLLVADAVLVAALNGPLGGSRRHVIVLILTLLCIERQLNFRRLNRAPGLVMGNRLILALGLVFVLAWGYLRTYSIQDLLNVGIADVGETSDYTQATGDTFTATYETFDEIIDFFPNRTPYQLGYTFYNSLALIVPRQWWESKPEGTATWLTTTFGDTGGNTAPTWPGELYLNFGTVGLMVGTVFLGMVLAVMARHIATGAQNFSSAMVYAVSLALPFEWIWGGSNTVMWYFLGTLGPICLGLKLTSLRHQFPISHGPFSPREAAIQH